MDMEKLKKMQQSVRIGEFEPYILFRQVSRAPEADPEHAAVLPAKQRGQNANTVFRVCTHVP